jgi:hypothetical protein
MTFGEAIEALNGGHRIARPEWGGEGAWLILRRRKTGGITHFMVSGNVRIDLRPLGGLF